MRDIEKSMAEIEVEAKEEYRNSRVDKKLSKMIEGDMRKKRRNIAKGNV